MIETSLGEVKKAFSKWIELRYLIICEEKGKVTVRGREFFSDKLFRCLNDMVIKELGGTYSRLDRGFLIPIRVELEERYGIQRIERSGD